MWWLWRSDTKCYILMVPSHHLNRCGHIISWWRQEMETFSALLALCAGNSRVAGEFPAQRPVTRSFDVFVDLRLNKRLSKQSRGWWFETPSCPLWHLCNVSDHLRPSFEKIYLKVSCAKCRPFCARLNVRLIQIDLPSFHHICCGIFHFL